MERPETIPASMDCRGTTSQVGGRATKARVESCSSGLRRRHRISSRKTGGEHLRSAGCFDRFPFGGCTGRRSPFITAEVDQLCEVGGAEAAAEQFLHSVFRSELCQSRRQSLPLQTGGLS
jgi:hypothetical protein